MIKKIISICLITVMILSSTVIYAATSSSQQEWQVSLTNLKSYGILSDSDININGNMARGTFAKLIVGATGNTELAQSLEGSSSFSDVSNKSDLCGYINAAANKGYMTALSDGTFKPNGALNYAQLCTAIVKALEYTGSDIIGTWPNGYIEKAKSLGLTTSLNLKSNDTVSTKQALIVINLMLQTNIRKANAADTDKTLAEAAGLINGSHVYGKPEIVTSSGRRQNGNIYIQPGYTILRNTIDTTSANPSNVIGEKITLNDIKLNDVLYQVYNKDRKLLYYLVIDHKISGTITSILPNKYEPKTIQIKNVNYDLESDANLSKFNTSDGSFNIGDEITALFGYDGKIVDASYSEAIAVGNFAFVNSTGSTVSKEIADYGKTYYTVNLTFTDGTTATYKTTENPSPYYLRLVKYYKIDSDTVSLENVNYINSDTQYTVKKDEKMLDSSYIADNCKIFNYVNGSGIKLINWSDMPRGILQSGKVIYLNKAGDFEDINLILLNDVFNEEYKLCTVQKEAFAGTRTGVAYNYTMLSEGNSYVYSDKEELTYVDVGTVVRVKMFGGNVNTVYEAIVPADTALSVQGIDSKRIKINNKIYDLKDNVSVYIKDSLGNLTQKGIPDIVKNKIYGSVKIYTDRPISYGGKVEVVVISEL